MANESLDLRSCSHPQCARSDQASRAFCACAPGHQDPRGRHGMRHHQDPEHGAEQGALRQAETEDTGTERHKYATPLLDLERMLTACSTESVGTPHTDIYPGARQHSIGHGSLQGVEGGPTSGGGHDEQCPPHLPDQGVDVGFPDSFRFRPTSDHTTGSSANSPKTQPSPTRTGADTCQTSRGGRSPRERSRSTSRTSPKSHTRPSRRRRKRARWICRSRRESTFCPRTARRGWRSRSGRRRPRSRRRRRSASGKRSLCRPRRRQPSRRSARRRTSRGGRRGGGGTCRLVP